MPTDFEELKRRLLQTDSEFRQLATQHHDLDERLHHYAERHYLTDPEQVADLARFPGEYCYFASEWQGAVGEPPIVLLQRHH